MSFSTQKNFLSIAFPIEPKDQEAPRKRSDAALKTYPSCADARAWTFDKMKNAQYISDIVHRFPQIQEQVS
jgi:hypothetical protein